VLRPKKPGPKILSALKKKRCRFFYLEEERGTEIGKKNKTWEHMIKRGNGWLALKKTLKKHKGSAKEHGGKRD